MPQEIPDVSQGLPFMGQLWGLGVAQGVITYFFHAGSPAEVVEKLERS